jgi:hypothetical protein
VSSRPGTLTSSLLSATLRWRAGCAVRCMSGSGRRDRKIARLRPVSHSTAHLGRVPVPGRRDRCILEESDRLGDGDTPAHGAGAGRAEHGLRTTSTQSVVFHSDRGTQFTSIAFGSRCKQMNVKPSMGSTGDAYDNAMAESFFATLECELLNRRCFKTQVEARMAIFEFIEGWYNLTAYCLTSLCH